MAIDTHPNVEGGSAVIEKLNADIETLMASKDKIEAAHLKSVFESAIAILTLARVSLLLDPRSCRNTDICHAIRTG